MSQTEFKAMPTDKLLSMYRETESTYRDLKTVLTERLTQESAELAAGLARIGLVSAKASDPHGRVDRRKGPRKTTAGRKVAVKYRNPKDHSQIWTGRGSMTRWLRDAIASGRRIEDFLVDKR